MGAVPCWLSSTGSVEKGYRSPGRSELRNTSIIKKSSVHRYASCTSATNDPSPFLPLDSFRLDPADEVIERLENRRSKSNEEEVRWV
jgi:hypothetical protein